MFRLVIFLDKNEADVLRSLAKKEYRDVRSQATLILKEALIRRMSAPSTTITSMSIELENQQQALANQTIKEDDYDHN